MTEYSANTKRIAKNTMMLYIRMLFGMLVSLYTSRVVLQALGVEDYGIYNVVGGLVATFSLLSGSLSAAVSRFLTFELGKGELKELKRIFSTSVWIHVALGIIVLILLETIGLWFLNNKMVIPADRYLAANWVFQASITSFFVGLLSVPYNASIVSHERMSMFAYIGILDIFLRLLIVLFVAYSPWHFDKLIVYALLLVCVSISMQCFYFIYCRRNFDECHVSLFFDKIYWNRMCSFAGWNFIGASSAVLRDQGGNLLLNIFGGPTLNAARGISVSVNAAVGSFVGNFMVAVNPQITKSYASGDIVYMMSLIYRSARMSFYLLLLLSLPILLNTKYLLTLWLGVVPEHAVQFVQLILIFAMCESISNPLVTAMLATGRIKKYQIVVGGLQMCNLPLSYLLLKNIDFPEGVLVIAIFLSVICLLARLYMLRDLINLSINDYTHKVLLNVFIIALVNTIIIFLMQNEPASNFFEFFFSCLFCLISSGCTIFFLGCTKNERKFIIKRIRNIINKKL